MAATVVLVFTFLCGVQIGRNIKGDRVAASDAADTAASSPAAPPPASIPTQSAASSGPPAAEPPAPAQEPDDELSYAKRLQQADPAAGDKIQAKPAQTAAPAPKPQPAAPAPRPAAEPVGSSHPGTWIVQLSALQDRNAAANIARDLARKGYPAFVVDPAPGSPSIYRVQVRGYAARDKADRAAAKWEKKKHLKPYVRSR